MSGNIVGGLVGAAIGFVVGGPSGAAYGWMIGSTAGALLFPNNPRGPDLTDLKPQSSEYGRPIPIVYSIMALDGTVIWASDLVKISDGSGGGKGSESATGPTYAANFAVMICESNDGDVGLGRIFAGPEKRMIYNPSGATMESGTLTFYNGSETQMPDPLMESYLGAGNVPAYRGRAYIVIENFDVTAHDGNRIPFLTIEVGRTGDTTPPTLGTVWFTDAFETATSFYFLYMGSYRGFLEYDKATMTFQHNRDLTLEDWSGSDHVFLDAARGVIVRAHRGLTNLNWGGVLYTTTSAATGTVTNHAPFTPDNGEALYGFVQNDDGYIACFRAVGGGVRFRFIDPDTHTATGSQVVDAGSTELLSHVYSGGPAQGFVFGVTNAQVRTYTTDGVTTTSTAVGAPVASFSDYRDGGYDPNTNFLWLAHFGTGGISWTVHDPNAGLVYSATEPSQFHELAGGRGTAWLFIPPAVGEPAGAVYLIGNRWLAVDHYKRFDPLTGQSVGLEIDGGYVGINDLDVAIYNDATNKIVGLREGGFYAISSNLSPATLPYDTGRLGGVDSSLNKHTLAEVVTDLSVRAGLSPSDIDVTELTDVVDGYALANQMAVKDAIAALMPVYYFDAYEDQGVVVFKKRGGDVAVEIPDDDLGAQEADTTDEGGDLLQFTRATDEELPWTFSVSYVLAATNYSQATKYARRLVGNSGNQAAMQLPMVLSDQKAAQVAAVNLHGAWVARTSYRFTLPRKYAYLAPTDLVGIQGYVMRITKITQQASGVYAMEAVRDDSDTYTPTVIVDETPPTDGTTVEQPSLTLLEVM